MVSIAAQVDSDLDMVGFDFAIGNHSKTASLQELGRYRRTIKREMERNRFNVNQRNPESQILRQTLRRSQCSERFVSRSKKNKYLDMRVGVRCGGLNGVDARRGKLDGLKWLVAQQSHAMYVSSQTVNKS